MRAILCCCCLFITACLTSQAQLDAWSTQHFLRAREAQKSNQLDIAITEYKLVLSRHPEFAEGFLNLGIAYSLQERYPNAIMAFKTALKHKPQLVQARILLAITYYTVEDFDHALAELDLVLAKYPHEKQASLYRAFTLRGLDRPEAAVQELRGLAILYPHDVKISYELGEAYREAALKSGYVLADKGGDSALRDWALALSAEQKHDNDLAILYYARALAVDPNIPQIYERLATVFEMEQDPELAQKVRARFLLQGPGSSSFSVEEREQQFSPRMKVQDQNDYAALWDKLGSIHPRSGVPLIADSSIDTLVEGRLETKGSDALRAAVSLYEKGEYSGAVARLKRQGHLGHWIDAYVLARSLLAANDPDAAEEILETYLSAQYQVPSVALLKLEVQSMLAAKVYDVVLTSEPESTEAHILRAQSLAAENHANQAVDEYHEILKLAPTLKEIHLAIGKLYLDQGHWPDAAAEFVQELALSPNNSLALALLGHAYTEADQPLLAAPVLEKLLVLFPKDAAALADYGKVLTQKGEKRRAIEAFERALKEDSSQYRLHYRLFQLYRSAGQDDLAQMHLALFQREEAKSLKKGMVK